MISVIEIVAAGIVVADLVPNQASFLGQQGFEPAIQYVGVGQYRLSLSDLTLVSPSQGMLLLTPAVDGCSFSAAMTDQRTIAVRFEDLLGNPRDAQFYIAVGRFRFGA